MSDAVIKEQEEVVNRINAVLGELNISQGQSGLDHIPWIVFLLANKEYAISVSYVLRVAILYEIIPYMDAPAYCPGVMWDRKGMIRLLDLRAFFGQGDFFSAITREKHGLPMIVVVGLNGTRCGIIVDEILMIGNLGTAIDALTDEDHAPSCPIMAKLRYDCLKAPALILSPEIFSTLEFEHEGTKLHWKGYLDMRLKAEKMRE